MVFKLSSQLGEVGVNEEKLKADYALTTMMREAIESFHRRLIATMAKTRLKFLHT